MGIFGKIKYFAVNLKMEMQEKYLKGHLKKSGLSARIFVKF